MEFLLQKCFWNFPILELVFQNFQILTCLLQNASSVFVIVEFSDFGMSVFKKFPEFSSSGISVPEYSLFIYLFLFILEIVFQKVSRIF